MAVSAASAGQTAVTPQRPKLVVGIVVDQLRTDYIEYLRPLFGQRGFNRLLAEGVYMPDIDFESNVSDPAAATAIIFTGNFPAANGIPSSKIYDAASSSYREVLTDRNSLGNFTSEALSPANLRLSTIADEIAMDGAGLSAVYAIAPDAQQAIILAGHAGNSAVWLNDRDGNWSSTAYYRDFPVFAGHRNRTRPLLQRLDTLQWKPSLPLEQYPGIPAQKKYYPFRHTFPRADRDAITRFKASAPVNREITDLAVETLSTMKLGVRSGAIDMLNVAYTAAPYKYVKDGDYRIELEDTYLRLDAQLARLLDALDQKVGLDNTLIFLTSTGYYNDATVDDPKYRIPTGDVSLKRVQSLLNSFFSAKYGNADYVKGIYGNNSATQVYLNEGALESHGVNLEHGRREAGEFLVKMSGIAAAHPLADILSDNSPRGTRLRNTLDPKTAGDLLLEFLPGWTVTDDTSYPANSWPVRYGMVSAPAIIRLPGGNPSRIDTPVNATSLAPTITSALHIRSPNGSASHPVIMK